MISSIKHRATIGTLIALGFLLATLMTMLLSAAPAHAAAPSGKAFSWGANDHGELGNGTTGADTNTPGEVIGLTGVTSISGGAFHSLAILESGKARLWGDNGNGELGNGASGADRHTPGVVKNLSNVKNIDGGNAFTLAATE